MCCAPVEDGQSRGDLSCFRMKYQLEKAWGESKIGVDMPKLGCERGGRRASMKGGGKGPVFGGNKKQTRQTAWLRVQPQFIQKEDNQEGKSYPEGERGMRKKKYLPIGGKDLKCFQDRSSLCEVAT